MNLNLATIFAIAIAAVPSGFTMAQVASHSQVASGPHGGALRQTDGVQLETIVTQGGIRMFVYDNNQQPVSVEGSRGVAALRVAGNAKRYRYSLLPDGKGGLTAPVNLSELAGRQIQLDIQLVDIAGAVGRVSIQEIASVPLSESQLAAAAIARQKICPVTGKPLGSMGQPVAVDVSGERLFVCCAGCAPAVKADPAKYAASEETRSVPAGSEFVRAGVFKVTEEDQPFIAAQVRCPVMDEPLDAMGGPYKVNAAGKAIYICCPGCAKKIAAEPQKYLGILARQGVQSPVLR